MKKKSEGKINTLIRINQIEAMKCFSFIILAKIKKSDIINF